MNNNKGFTLIELIICIAVTAVLIGGVYINANLLVYANTKSCTEKIDSTLGKLRVETMSKGSQRYYLVIEWDTANQCYYLNTAISEEALNESNWKTKATAIRSKKIANRNITISYTKKSDGIDKVTVDSSNPSFLISFYSSSGAFESEWKQIIVSSRTGSSTVHMVTKTGKHYIK